MWTPSDTVITAVASGLAAVGGALARRPITARGRLIGELTARLDQLSRTVQRQERQLDDLGRRQRRLERRDYMWDGWARDLVQHILERRDPPPPIPPDELGITWMPDTPQPSSPAPAGRGSTSAQEG
jgi:hypothetical protein